MLRYRSHFIQAAAVIAVLSFASLAIWKPWQANETDRAAQASRIAEGRKLYVEQCARCHGANLEGQPNWRERKPDGKLPAPPHDASGHTWHHTDEQLFEMTRNGVSEIVPGYVSDMPAFKDTLSDEQIWLIIKYIENTWSAEIKVKRARMSGNMK